MRCDRGSYISGLFIPVMSAGVMLAAAANLHAEERSARDRLAITSTAASAELTLEQWRADTVPDQFASRALEAAGQKLTSELATLVQDDLDDNRDPQPDLGQAALLLHQELQAQRAVEANDRNGSEAVALTLREIRQRMSAAPQP